MPGLERLPQFEVYPTVADRAEEREAELALSMKPFRIERIASGGEVIEHAEKVLPDEMLEHETVVQRGAPPHQRAALRHAPEPRDQGAQQQLLGQRHARIGRHLEGAEFDQAESTGRTVRREQLVDADLGAMGIAGDIDEEVAEQPVDEPRRRRVVLVLRWHRRQRDLQLIELVVARFIDARRLAGGPDEQAGKQIGQRRVALPIEDQALEQIRPTQERAVRRSLPAHHHVIAATRAGMAAVEHEFVGAEPREPRFLVERAGVVDGLAPSRGGVDVDLDDARVGRHLDDVEPRIRRRLVAFHVDGNGEIARASFDHGEQLEVILQPLDRGHEDADPSVADLDREGGAHRWPRCH